MGLSLLFAAVGQPGSFWNSPSNVAAVIWLGFGIAAIALALGLAKVFHRFNGVAWLVLAAGALISLYGLWLMLT